MCKGKLCPVTVSAFDMVMLAWFHNMETIGVEQLQFLLEENDNKKASTLESKIAQRFTHKLLAAYIEFSTTVDTLTTPTKDPDSN